MDQVSAALLADPEPTAGARVDAASFILSLRARGVRDLGVLRAMERVPRDLFAPRRYADLARSDVALPLAFGQSMTAPAAVAAMLAALGCGPGQRILEVGTGSGYVSALLIAMGGEVRSVERLPILAESAGLRLKAAGLGGFVEIACRDGLCDDAEAGRLDRVLVNGTLASVPPALTSRLKVGGRLVCGLATPNGPRLLTILRGEDGSLARSVGAPLRLTPIRCPDVANGEPSGATEA